MYVYVYVYYYMFIYIYIFFSGRRGKLSAASSLTLSILLL